jgi:hypothetical protein
MSSNWRRRPLSAAMINQKFVDTAELSAWPIGGGRIRIQTRVPQMAEAVGRLKHASRSGYSVSGGYLRLFDIIQSQRTVHRNLIRVLTRISTQGLGSQEPRGGSRKLGVVFGQRKFGVTRCRPFKRMKVSSRIRLRIVPKADWVAQGTQS